MQEHANLLVEQNSVASLTAYNDDLKESRAQLANAVKQMEASSSRLRAELDQVGASGPTAMADYLRDMSPGGSCRVMVGSGCVQLFTPDSVVTVAVTVGFCAVLPN